MELIPIRVRIKLRSNGHADHPNWRRLPLAEQGGEDPAIHMFHGWKYDKTSGHAESTPDSPLGTQFGVVLVTETFAMDALAVYPTLVEVLTEAELEVFWDEKAYGHLASERTNVDVLQGLAVERQLRVAVGQPTGVLDIRIAKALNPDDAEPGKRKDHMRRWQDAKVRLDVTIGELP